MAVWQFDLQLMPDVVAADAAGFIAGAITKDGLDTTCWWSDKNTRSDYQEIIIRSFSELDSWCKEIRRWGDEAKVLVEMFIEHECVIGVFVRIDVRHADREAIATLVSLAQQLHCHFYVMETQKVIPPDLKLLVQNVASSRAVEFARDPVGFIDRVARECGT